jgi:hypothetical protein
MPAISDAAREARLRRLARKCDLVIVKSRLRGWPTPDDHGGYMVVDPGTNFPQFGFKFDADLDDLEAYFRQAEEV